MNNYLTVVIVLLVFVALIALLFWAIRHWIAKKEARYRQIISAQQADDLRMMQWSLENSDHPAALRYMEQRPRLSPAELCLESEFRRRTEVLRSTRKNLDAADRDLIAARGGDPFVLLQCKGEFERAQEEHSKAYQDRVDIIALMSLKSGGNA